MIIGDADAAADLDRETLSMALGDDPVHPSTVAYNDLAESSIKNSSTMQENNTSSNTREWSTPSQEASHKQSQWSKLNCWTIAVTCFKT